MAGETIKTHLDSPYDGFNGGHPFPLFAGPQPEVFQFGSPPRTLQRSGFLSTILLLVSRE